MAQTNSGGRGSQHVRDVMTSNPVTVSQRDDVVSVARIMRDEDTGVVPVVDGRKIIGLITDRDIVVRAIAEGKNLNDVRVNDVMTKQVRSVKEDTPVRDVLELMSGAQVRRVPVVNDSGELIGIVSMKDIATESGQDGKVGQAVEDISRGPANN